MFASNPLISIVDDDASLRRSVKRLLESAGCQVEAFAGAEYFLSATRFKEPSCILLDLQMGSMGGMEMAEFMRELGRTIPIIIITGMGEDVAAQCARDAGAYGYLTKPIDSAQLLEMIRTLVAPPSTEEESPTDDNDEGAWSDEQAIS